jgi:hypothetical protein
VGGKLCDGFYLVPFWGRCKLTTTRLLHEHGDRCDPAQQIFELLEEPVQLVPAVSARCWDGQFRVLGRGVVSGDRVADRRLVADDAERHHATQGTSAIGQAPGPGSPAARSGMPMQETDSAIGTDAGVSQNVQCHRPRRASPIAGTRKPIERLPRQDRRVPGSRRRCVCRAEGRRQGRLLR